MAGYKEVKELIDTHMVYVRDNQVRIEKHLSKINGHLDDHSFRLKQVEDAIQTERRLARERRKLSKKVLGGYGAIIVSIAVALWKAFTGSN